MNQPNFARNRDGRRHSTKGFSESVAVAEKVIKQINVLILTCDRDQRA